MADETIKKLLLKIGISTADWKTAVDDIRSKLNSVNEQAKKDAAQMKATQKEQLDLTKQQIAEQQRLTAEARTLQAVDSAKAQWQKQQQEAIKTAVQQRILETAEAKKQQVIGLAQVKLEQEKLRLAQQQYTLSERQRLSQERQLKNKGGEGGSGILGGIGNFASKITGGGLIGSIAGGVLAGGLVTEGALKLLDAAGEKIHSLGEALLDASGPAAQLREQFEKLSQRAGSDPEEYLTKLRTATRGLADDVALYRIANNYMQQGLHVTQDQIVRLVGATVDLARAQGKTAPEAMNALERASKTGRSQILAMVTGLTRQELSLKGTSAALDATTRNTMQFNQVLAALEAREKAIGTPATTLPEILKKWQTAQKNLIDDTAYAVTRTKGFQDAIASLSTMIDEFTVKMAPAAKSFGEFLGPLLGASITMIAQMMKNLWQIVSEVTSSVTQLFQAFQKPPSKSDFLNDTVVSLTSIKGVLLTVYNIWQAISTTIKKTLIDLDQMDANLAIMATTSPTKWAEKFHENELRSSARYGQVDVQAARERAAFAKPLIDAGTNVTSKAAGPQHDVDPNIAGAKQRQQLRLQLAEETAKLEYEIAMQGLKKQEDAAKAAYESGLIDLTQEIDKERSIYAAEHKAKMDELREERDAKIANILASGKAAGTPQDIIQMQVKKELLSSSAQEQAETTSYQQKGFGLDEKQQADKLAAAREAASELSRLAKEGIQDQLQTLEEGFKQGIVDANTYLSQRKGLIEEEKKAALEGLNLQFSAAENNEKERQRLNNQGLEAERQYQRQLSQLLIQESAIRLQASQNRYQLQTKPLQTQLEVAKGDTTGSSIPEQEQLIQQLRFKAVQQIATLTAQSANPALDHQSKEWFELQEHIAAAVMELQKYNQELNQMHNIAGPMGSIFGSISGLAGSIPRSRTAAGVSELFGSMQQSTKDIGTFTSAAANEGGAGANSGSELFKKLGSTFEDIFKSGGNAAEKLQAFGDNLSNVISGVMGMIKGVTSGKSGAGGALSGGMAGAQFGAAFGPWGELAGGVGGALMGGIFGSKEKQLQQDIHKVTTQLQSIVSDLQAGTISLSQAIQDLRQERQQAIQLLAQDPKGGKGGGKGGKKGYTPSQAQAVIQQIDSQIQSLVNQQTQILQSLSTSLMEVSNPLQYQDYLQSLDQIIQKYQEFASAAQGNAQEMTAANQYLNDSLNQYVVTLSQNLNQAQQTAINDALTLINLEYQRQQLINQEAQSQYDVLTQGVLTRQRTTAMTKGQEIGQLQYQRDMQLEQINEQISLQQYKVQTETQIFNLATTRIGLENQLLAAQEEQANYQIQQVVALSQVVADLTSGLSGGALMQQITQLMSTGAMPTESGIMYALLQLLGLAGNVPPTATQGQYGTGNWLANIPATDASAAQYVASLDPNFPNLIMSGQYAAAAQEAQQYQQQGEVEGYDMNDLISWLQQQGGTSGYAEGGTVEQTGPALVHKGEFVLSNPMVAALNAMAGGTPSPTPPATNQIPVHQTLLDITSQRTSMEMTVITARQSQIQAEMQLLQAMNDTYSTISSGNGSPTMGIEDMLQKVYQNRGRAGSAGFTRQSI